LIRGHKRTTIDAHSANIERQFADSTIRLILRTQTEKEREREREGGRGERGTSKRGRAENFAIEIGLYARCSLDLPAKDCIGEAISLDGRAAETGH